VDEPEAPEAPAAPDEPAAPEAPDQPEAVAAPAAAGESELRHFSVGYRDAQLLGLGPHQVLLVGVARDPG
jgi:hypothetical protein